jgi:hypothetical protein
MTLLLRSPRDRYLASPLAHRLLPSNKKRSSYGCVRVGRGVFIEPLPSNALSKSVTLFTDFKETDTSTVEHSQRRVRSSTLQCRLVRRQTPSSGSKSTRSKKRAETGGEPNTNLSPNYTMLHHRRPSVSATDMRASTHYQSSWYNHETT